MAAPSPQLSGVTLRPIRQDDMECLYRIYAGTREEELSVTGWTEDEKERFLRMQFHAQHTHYQKTFTAASWDMIEQAGRPIGRLYLDRRPEEIRVIDIALLKEARGRGIGGALMRRILDEAAGAGKLVRIHVERNNPAMRLYNRLGFRKVEDQGVYWLMEWSPEPAPSAQVNTAS